MGMPVGIATLVVVTILGFALGGADRSAAASTGGGGGGGGDAAFPDASEQEILDEVPASLSVSCKRASRAVRTSGENGVGGRRTEAVVRCTPRGDGADRAFFTLLANRDRLESAFDDVADAAGVEDTGEDCADVNLAQHDYTTEDNVDGRVACYRDGGESYLVWSLPEFRILGSVQRDDRNDGDLYDFWAEAVDRTPPESDGGGSDLTAAEQELLTHVPDSFSDTCEGVEPAESEEVAVLECTPGEGADIVDYTQFVSAGSMDITYMRILRFLGIDPGSGPGCAVGPPSDDIYTVDDVDAGRLACFSDDDDGAARLAWTHDDTFILSEAFLGDGDHSTLYSWWTDDSGPL